MFLKPNEMQSRELIRSTIPAIIISFLLFLSEHVYGAETGNGDTLKSIDKYIEFALTHNPGIKAAADAIAAQNKQASIAASLPDPMGMVSGAAGSGNGIGGIGISQEIMFPTKLLNERKAALQLVRKKEADLNQNKADLVKEIRKVYAELYKTGQIVKFQKETLELLKLMESITRANYASANASQGALLKIQVEQTMMDDEIRSMELEGKSLEKYFASLLAIDSKTTFDYPDSLPDVDLQLSQTELVQRVLENSPVLKGMEKEIEAASTMVKLAQNQFLPDFKVGAEYMKNRTTSMGTASSGGEWDIEVSMSIPVWFDKNLKQIGKAKDMQSEMKHNRQNMTNKIISEITEMYNEYSDSKRKIDLFSEVLIPQAKQVLTLMQTGYKTAMMPVIEYLDAQRTLLDLRMKLAEEEARKEYALASINSLLGETTISVQKVNYE